MKRKLEVLVLAAMLSTALAAAAVAGAASTPSVATGSVSNVTDGSAVLHGTIDPNGKSTAYYFQWGLTNAYGVGSVAHSAGRGTKPVSVKAAATALIPGTVYHYRLVATSGSGLSIGADRTFKTAGNPPPLVATGPPAQVGTNSVTMTAVINPNKQATTYYFEYGILNSFLSQTAVATVPAGPAPVTVALTVQGLEAQTIFEYRVVAQHSNSPAQPGATESFMTLPRQRPVPHIRARTRPRSVPHAPYKLTTSGSVTGPGWIPGQYDCIGDVKVKFFRGGRLVEVTLMPLQPNCTFSGQSLFAHFPRGKQRPTGLTVVAQFDGNGYLTPRRTSPETITLG
jgi:phosphodiesterase/alkaline phosphatase D-like protein